MALQQLATIVPCISTYVWNRVGCCRDGIDEMYVVLCFESVTLLQRLMEINSENDG